MAKVSDLYVGKQLMVGEGRPEILGQGALAVRGSAFIEGPALIGDADTFFGYTPKATLMVGPTSNIDNILQPNIDGSLCVTGEHNPYSLAVEGAAAFFGPIDTNSTLTVGESIVAQGDISSKCGLHRLSAKKNFDIPHPSREGWRLRHTCPEAPTNDVYIRGKVKNKTEINLPEYWKDFVYQDSITVSLTPIGAHQDVIVKRIDAEKIYLQAKSGIPINCFYHVYAERKIFFKVLKTFR